jgi:hypothetical protein
LLLRGYGDELRQIKKVFHATVHGMEILGNMPHTFGMGTMGMRVKTDIVKIDGGPFRDLSHKTLGRMRAYMGGIHVPSRYIGIVSPQRYGNVQGFGKVYGIGFRAICYTGDQGSVFL